MFPNTAWSIKSKLFKSSFENNATVYTVKRWYSAAQQVWKFENSKFYQFTLIAKEIWKHNFNLVPVTNSGPLELASSMWLQGQPSVY